MGYYKNLAINMGLLKVEPENEPELKKPLPFKAKPIECEYCEKVAERIMRVTDSPKDEVGYSVSVCLEHYETINKL